MEGKKLLVSKVWNELSNETIDEECIMEQTKMVSFAYTEAFVDCVDGNFEIGYQLIISSLLGGRI